MITTREEKIKKIEDFAWNIRHFPREVRKTELDLADGLLWQLWIPGQGADEDPDNQPIVNASSLINGLR